MARPFAFYLASLCPLLLAAACTEGMPHATSADAARVVGRYPTSSLTSLEDGRRLYVQRCGGCHVRARPSSLCSQSWWRAAAASSSGMPSSRVATHLTTGGSQRPSFAPCTVTSAAL